MSASHINENETTTRIDDESDIEEATGTVPPDDSSSTASSTEQSSDDEVPNATVSVGDLDECTGIILIPNAGACNDSDATRRVRNGCAICLCSFEEETTVTWSSNTCCPHVFHHTCVVDWLMASGRKHLKRLRRQENQEDVPSDPVERVISFPMLCPCCRQEFVIPEDESSEEESLKSNPTEETRTNSIEEVEETDEPVVGEEAV